MTEDEIRYLLFEYEPFPGYKDTMRAIEIEQQAHEIYARACAAMYPVRVITRGGTASTSQWRYIIRNSQRRAKRRARKRDGK